MMPLRWLHCSLRLPPPLPALSGRRDGESCPVGPHRHGRGCCRRQNVSTDVPCVCNVTGGLWPRSLDPLGKPTLRSRSRFAKFRAEGASRYPSAPLVESLSSTRRHDLAERMALPVRSILVKWMEHSVQDRKSTRLNSSH